MTVALTGLVLAGGESTRMGTDKLVLPLRGERLIDLACAALTPICSRVLLASRGRSIPGLDLELVDDAEGEGPLAAIVGALAAAGTPLVAVVAADMPAASTDVFRRLARAWQGEPAVVPLAGGVPQPLHAVYATAALETFSALLAAGERSPRRAAMACGAAMVGAAVYDPDGTAGAFWTNINSPQDLARVEG